MRKRAEKIFAAIVGAIPLPGAYHGLSDAENVKSAIEAELTAAVREEREKWEGPARELIKAVNKRYPTPPYTPAFHKTGGNKICETRDALEALLTEAP